MTKQPAADLPKVSIVAISYDQEQYIRQALDGFLAQRTNFNFEVIIGDDCSTDGSQAIIDEYIKSHPGLIRQVKRKNNVGVQRNFYETMGEARGQYIAICECDDYWTDPEKLQKQVDFLDSHPDYALCFHSVKIVFEDDSQSASIYPQVKADFTIERLLQENFMQTNSVMYRKQSYGKMPLNILPLDWYLHLYHAQFGKIGFIDDVMSVYRRHPGGLWWDSHANMDKLWRKHGLPHLSLYVELLKLYGQDAKYKKIINQHIISALNKLSDVDKQNQAGLLDKAFTEFPECAGILIDNFREQIAALDKHAREQADIIEHYVDKSDTLEKENRHLRQQLDAIRNSRTYRAARAMRRTVRRHK